MNPFKRLSALRAPAHLCAAFPSFGPPRDPPASTSASSRGIRCGLGKVTPPAPRAPRAEGNASPAGPGEVDRGGPGAASFSPPSIAVPVGAKASPRTELDEFILWLRNFPWKRAILWTLTGAVAFALHDFFTIIMLTFILSFLGNGFVNSLSGIRQLRFVPPTWRRRGSVLLYYALIIGLVSLFGLLTIPSLIKEGADFVVKLQSDSVWVVILDKMRHGLGDGIMDKVEQLVLMVSSEDLQRAAAAATESAAKRTQVVGSALHAMLSEYTESAVRMTTTLVTATTKAALNVAISLILSFMFTWDLPTIAQGVRSLASSRIAPVYNEVAPAVLVFATLFGKALEAQARISLTNTVLTGLGMWALNLPGIGLLSLFVFICGFVPIAGVFLSTVPMGFVALTEFGFAKLALVIAMVVGVHFVEAYGLNPAIYSAHLKLHPLIVLAVLFFAEHSLGVWGLLLAVPTTVFALDYCIRYPERTVAEVAKAELEAVQKSIDFDEDESYAETFRAA